MKKAELAVSHKEISTIVSATAFEQLAWWPKLNTQEQTLVISESQKLGEALIVEGNGRLAVGEHLVRLQATLEPHNLFQRFLKHFHFSKRTAYRRIAGYNNAKARLPEPILHAAMARGVNIIGESDIKPLGVYTDAVAKLPPPQNATADQATTWLEQIESVRRQTKTEQGNASLDAIVVPQDPNTLMKECFKFVSLRYKRLPNNAKTRSNWVRTFVGMVLTELGVSGQQTIQPVAIPAEFQVSRGRPRLSALAS